MRNTAGSAIVVLACLLFLPWGAIAQQAKPTDAGRPRRDISGFWVGESVARLNPIPPMTPVGEAAYRMNKENASRFSIAESNDPFKFCDPLGFPRNVLFMAKGIAFAQMPDRVLQLHHFNRTWREIWTDGRRLPQNVGGVDREVIVDPWRSTFEASTIPKWFGYSTGRWDGDYTFIINTAGTRPDAWLTHTGYPHSVDMRVEERYTRIDRNTLELVVTIDDSKMYAKPFVITKSSFTWSPTQQFDEQFCVPSEALEYLKALGDPAGSNFRPIK
jgi:hypothetical protein